MPIINRQLFAADQVLRVGDVSLSLSDDLETHREKLARVVVDGMFEFVGLLDAEGSIVELSRGVLEWARLEFGEIQGVPFWEAPWWGDSTQTRRQVRELISRARAGEFMRCEFDVYGKRPGGEHLVIDFSLRPIRDVEGKVVLLLPEGRDITEMRRAKAEIDEKNRELQELLDQVRQIDAIKNNFFANISHELRTPLALILGPAESVLADEDNLTATQRRNVEVIHRNAATLLKHVNDLLDLAKIDAGRMSMEYRRIDLARAVRTVAAHFEALAEERDLSYEVFTPELVDADVDEEKFARVLLNLLSNAFKFTPVGGGIRCALEVDGEDRVVLSVEDSGPGVQLEMRTAIFDRFAQGQGGTTRQFGGTGLGLAIAKEFVDLHGGSIAVSNASLGGALFRVELPRRAPAGSQPAEEGASHEVLAVAGVLGELRPPQPIPDSGEARAPGLPLVVVAEDNPDMRRYIVELLGSDYRVVPAADGAEALSCAMREIPDLVVTDLMMPRMGGDRLVQEMRARSALAHVPVLMLSASADEELRLKLLAETVQDYVTKPFSPQELRVRVGNLVVMKQLRDALQKELATQNNDISQLAQQLIASKHSLQRSLKARKLAEEKVRHLAYFDITTDLPNRTHLQELLEKAVLAGRDSGEPFALLVLSVERLKEINYTLGETDGNRLLRNIGPRVRAALHGRDTLAYYGERNFAVLCSGLGAHAASELATRLVRGFEQPFEIGGLTIEVGANVGIAVFPGHGDEAEVLMRHAEVALYRAQQEGKSVVLYSAEQDPYNPRRLQLMGELRTAIAARQLTLYGAPRITRGFV